MNQDLYKCPCCGAPVIATIDGRPVPQGVEILGWEPGLEFTYNG